MVSMGGFGGNGSSNEASKDAQNRELGLVRENHELKLKVEELQRQLGSDARADIAREEEGVDNIELLKRENNDFRQLFALQWTRSREADALWRAEDPEVRKNIWPDLGLLFTWLMDRIKVAESQVAVAIDAHCGCLGAYPENVSPEYVALTAPRYVHCLVDAYLNGATLNFGGNPVPKDIQARLTKAQEIGVLRSEAIKCTDPTDDTRGCTVPGHEHPTPVNLEVQVPMSELRPVFDAYAECMKAPTGKIGESNFREFDRRLAALYKALREVREKYLKENGADS